MTPGTVVLLHSPLTTASAWGSLPEALGAYEVVVPEITDDDRAPYAGRYVARAALEITKAGVRPPVVLVGHGGAGPLLPPIGGAQRAAHRLVGGYVFVDAELPPPAGSSRLDQATAFGAEFAESLKNGGRFPDEEPPAGVPSRPREEDFFTETLPMPQDWPDAPCGYLRTSPAYDGPAAQARLRGWTVTAVDAGHFAAVTDPLATARALTDLIAAL
ncbi:alpha/beta fold hydrolase [Actinoallomurus sp. CA-150999]|uniref:alpha/beta fold hydrolase n=1 Tax=Actinoallomurus sp. CA-150999 TaxID=3239887 RepID=UPI003D8E1100